jgi:two-component system LytT family response regulator
MNRRMRTILIDDEPLALKRLRRLLLKYDGLFEIIAEAENGGSGLELIELHKPELIFLDIEMPVLTGFEMLRKLKYVPKVIFTTAYEEFAIKAFEENSIDYLLKPVEEERLNRTVEKLKRLERPAAFTLPTDIQSLIESMTNKKNARSIPVKIGDKILLIQLEQIIYMEAREKYVFLVTEDGKEFLTDFTLNALEEKLGTPFIRVHRAFIINRDKIREVHKGFNSTFVVVMRDQHGTKISTGRSYVDQVRNLFEF